MVNTNRGVQDPSNDSTDNNVIPNNEIITAVDSDIDDDSNNYEGYQPLPANAEDVCSEEESDGDDDAEAAVSLSAPPPVQDLPAIVPIEQMLLKQVWDSGVSKDIEMDSNKVDAVKKAMINITLPPSSIPEWANSIPEEEWKATLLNKIQGFNKHK